MFQPSVRSNDGKTHNVQLLFGVSTDLAVNMPAQPVTAKAYTTNGLAILKAGTREQPVLQKKGDDLRIDWGYLYVAAPLYQKPMQSIAPSETALQSFTSGKTIAAKNGEGKHLLLSTVLPAGTVGAEAKENLIMLGYDDLYSVQYFGQNLRPWWKEDTTNTIEKELMAAAKDHKTVLEKCNAFNEQLYADATKAGGEAYAQLCVLATGKASPRINWCKVRRARSSFFPKKTTATVPSTP
jgi:hypothetical protein